MRQSHNAERTVLPRVIKVAVVDDHDLFREGLIALLQDYEELRVVLQAANGQSLLEQMARHKPYVVLLDIEMPVMNGLQTTILLREKFPSIKIICLSMHFNDAFIFEMFARGAHGFLPKDKTVEEVVDAIYSVLETGRYYTESITSAMVNGSRSLLNSSLLPLSELTEKETQVLKHICAEKTNKEIAALLGISVRTVESHRQALLNKTGAQNTVGLVKYALKQKLISPFDF